MRLVFILLASLLLSACASTERLPDMGPSTLVIPKEQTAYCKALPKFEERQYTEAEAEEILNSWITAHEECAGRHKVLSDFVLKMFPQK